MRKAFVVSASVALVSVLCIPAFAFGFGGPQSHEAAHQEAVEPIVQTPDDPVEYVAIQDQPVEIASPASEPQMEEVPAVETPSADRERGYYYVDEDEDGICDNYGSEDCGGAGNGYCDGSGAHGNGGYGAHAGNAGNGQGAVDRYCDGSGRGAHQGGHHGR